MIRNHADFYWLFKASQLGSFKVIQNKSERLILKNMRSAVSVQVNIHAYINSDDFKTLSFMHDNDSLHNMASRAYFCSRTIFVLKTIY